MCWIVMIEVNENIIEVHENYSVRWTLKHLNYSLLNIALYYQHNKVRGGPLENPGGEGVTFLQKKKNPA